jgi:HD-like signal output (HDOD) protein
MMQTAREAKLQVLKLKQLPPLSPTAARLLELLSDENLSLNGLSRVIAQDPGIAARILGVANSAYFGQTTPIHSVEDAVIRVLGLNMVKSLAFSIAISGAFDTSRCQGFDLEAYWHRSLATATCSQLLCRCIAGEPRPDPDGAYLAGLLFDIGVLVLVHLFPEDYAQVLLAQQADPQQDLYPLEEALVGLSSREAGAWLTDRWHLPDMIVRVVAQAPSRDADLACTLVGMMAEWVRSGFTAQQAPVHHYREQIARLGLTITQLESVQEEYIRKDEEIRSIASMLVKTPG